METPLKKVGSLWSEFKAFAFKGNMIDLAIAVVIGGAFSPVINSIVTDVIMPIVNLPFKLFREHAAASAPPPPPGSPAAVALPNLGYESWHIGPVMIGHVLAVLLQFIIVAFAVFIFVVKVQQMVVGKIAPPTPSEPTTKECPKCLSTIPIKATRCAHCCADIATA